MEKRIVVAISGASGSIYGLRMLEMLRAQQVHCELIVSPSGWLTIDQELPGKRQAISDLADQQHAFRNIGARIASGSFAHDGMVIAPCSMKTLAAIAHGFADNLITRAADVTLKERRRLVLLARETPLHLVHLRNMATVTEMGGIVFPPVPAFYHRPESIEDLVSHSCAHVMDLLGLPLADRPRWNGLVSSGKVTAANPASAPLDRL
ncbi:MAG: UbiX family flavin prenyltransferase [Betaproteobacteria bacterium]|nr:UbiX family flavin prenyltransferase [Betaproteobacteria bacterium]